MIDTLLFNIFDSILELLGIECACLFFDPSACYCNEEMNLIPAGHGSFDESFSKHDTRSIKTHTQQRRAPLFQKENSLIFTHTYMSFPVSCIVTTLH